MYILINDWQLRWLTAFSWLVGLCATDVLQPAWKLWAKLAQYVTGPTILN